MRNRIVLTMAVLTVCLCVHGVTVERTANLNVYYPEYTGIDLVCGHMPSAAQKNVEFCCEAAFTGELLSEFRHSNIADNHICSGVMKKGYRCRANTGGFVWKKGAWKFMKKEDYPTAANGWHMGFCQLLVIYNGVARPIGAKMRHTKHIFRALCEKNGRLCLIEANKVMTYEKFVKCLTEYNVTYALYLDMGAGWNYTWYRDREGKVKEVFPESKLAPNYRYRTNWLTFYR